MQWRSSGKTGSTPNLAQLNSANGSVGGGSGAINPNVQRYERAQLLKLRSAVDQLDPKITTTINELEIARTERVCEF